MAAPPRGRGYAMQAQKDSSKPLRRPGESGLKQRFGSSNDGNKEELIDSMCHRIRKMDLSDPQKELAVLEKDVLSLCNSLESLQTFIDKVFIFALQNKWNAHAIASFCEAYGDISVENVKLRTLLLRKLQKLYTDRESSYLTLNKFLMDVRFLCEIYFHVNIDGNCIQVLSHPVLDVLSMLVNGGSFEEVEVVYEQFPKCFANLKANDPDGVNNLLSQLRMQLVAKETPVTARPLLLEIFELILKDGKSLDQEAQKFYSSQAISILRICD